MERKYDIQLYLDAVADTERKSAERWWANKDQVLQGGVVVGNAVRITATIDTSRFTITVGGRMFYRCIIARRSARIVARRIMVLDWMRVARFMAAVWKNGSKHNQRTMRKFGLTPSGYSRRLAKYAEILGYRREC